LKSSSPIRSDTGPESLKTNKRAAAGLAAAFLLTSLSARARAGDTNFSQRPGFAAYFAANPPSAGIPDALD
jgi:hypothetical protein